MPTPAELIRMADELESQAAVLGAQIAGMREQARQLREEARRKTAGLPRFVYSATVRRKMEASKDEIAPRRGRKVKAGTPMALAKDNSGLPLVQIAEKLGVKYSTLKSWGVKANPPEEMRKALAAKPYSVPETAWKA